MDPRSHVPYPRPAESEMGQGWQMVDAELNEIFAVEDHMDVSEDDMVRDLEQVLRENLRAGVARTLVRLEAPTDDLLVQRLHTLPYGPQWAEAAVLMRDLVFEFEGLDPHNPRLAVLYTVRGGWALGDLRVPLDFVEVRRIHTIPHVYNPIYIATSLHVSGLRATGPKFRC